MKILSVLFLFLCFYGIKINKGQIVAKDEWLNRDSTLCLRGACAAYIFACHLPGMLVYLMPGYEKTWEEYCYPGFMIVGIFFMLSGYGLAVGSSNLRGFLPKRLGKLLIPYLIANIVYYVPEKILNPQLSVLDIFKSWFNGSPFVSYSWYIIAQIIFYCLFYISFKITKKKAVSVLVLLFFQLTYIFIVCKLGWFSPWHHGCLCFTLGVCFGCYKEEIYQWLSKLKYEIVLLASFAVAGVAYIIYILYFMENNVYDQSALFFVAFVILFYLKFRLNNRALRFFGKISLEIYLYHGLVLRSVKELLIRFGMQNSYLYIAVSIFITVLSAWMLHEINSILVNNYEKVLKRIYS